MSRKVSQTSQRDERCAECAISLLPMLGQVESKRLVGEAIQEEEPMKKVLRYTSLCMAVVVVTLLASGAVSAQTGYPSPADKYVNDYAGVLKQVHKDDLHAKLADLDEQTGIEATILTVASIHDYDTGDATIESFATNLFNTWGIGDSKKNDGLLILVAVRDRQVRIEVGKGYGSRLDQPMQRVIDEKMLPHFKQEDYSTGIYKGTLAAVEEVIDYAGLDGVDVITIDTSTSINTNTWLESLIIAILYFGFLIGVVLLIWRRGRRRPSRRRGSRKRVNSGWGIEDGRSYGGARGGSFSGGSSSSSSSAGGGSSSGGGASGDW